MYLRIARNLPTRAGTSDYQRSGADKRYCVALGFFHNCSNVSIYIEHRMGNTYILWSQSDTWARTPVFDVYISPTPGVSTKTMGRPLIDRLDLTRRMSREGKRLSWFGKTGSSSMAYWMNCRNSHEKNIMSRKKRTVLFPAPVGPMTLGRYDSKSFDYEQRGLHNNYVVLCEKYSRTWHCKRYQWVANVYVRQEYNGTHL